MNGLDVLTVLLCLVGAFFFLGGTLGLLRFPDLLSRLHAVTKADNLGLGFVVMGLIFQATSVAVALKLLLIWVLAMLAGSSVCHMLGRFNLGKSGK